VFTVTPAPAPKFWFMVIFGGVLILGGLTAPFGGGFPFLLMGGFSFWYGWFRDQRPKEHRNASTFRVTADSVEVGGRQIAKDDIHRFILRNGITDKELGIQQYNISGAQATGLARRAQLAMISNSLTLEAGGKATYLAGGMDEVTAYGLLRDVGAVLGFKETSY
jgi:hypothetical protein